MHYRYRFRIAFIIKSILPCQLNSRFTFISLAPVVTSLSPLLFTFHSSPLIKTLFVPRVGGVPLLIDKSFHLPLGQGNLAVISNNKDVCFF